MRIAVDAMGGDLAPQAIVEGAGFDDFAITWKAPVFEGAPQSSNAAAFGTVGVNYRASKPE